MSLIMSLPTPIQGYLEILGSNNKTQTLDYNSRHVFRPFSKWSVKGIGNAQDCSKFEKDSEAKRQALTSLTNTCSYIQTQKYLARCRWLVPSHFCNTVYQIIPPPPTKIKQDGKSYLVSVLYSYRCLLSRDIKISTNIVTIIKLWRHVKKIITFNLWKSTWSPQKKSGKYYSSVMIVN